ncbi:hypothetical protein [Actinokineospora bangkokensis]|uniref:hypothetical protein n=1 Tax=Actinokineospora bangkokensis TaxID=1193682 RepID=UPI0013017B75|nr:hypothetical protein [Actinokineospora bangkokensis]
MSAEQTVRFTPIPSAVKHSPTPAPRTPSGALPRPRPRKPLYKRIARRILGEGLLTKR